MAKKVGKFARQTAAAPAKRKKKGNLIFTICLLVYAVIFLVATWFGLNWFWDFIEAYELSRPQIAIDAYMNQVNEDYICDQVSELIDSVDHNLQSEEVCRQYIKDFLADEITYAKKSSECTDTKQVYVLRSGSQVVGSFAIVTTGEDEFGFTPWQLDGDSYDLSFLIGTSASISAPADYPVYANGVLLDSSYITGTEEIPYEVFEEYYDDYELPSFRKVTYTAGPILGEFTMNVTDPDGNDYVLDDTVDLNTFVDNCTGEEVAQLDGFVNEFLKRYVIFSGSANDARYTNYANLVAMIVPETKLASRMLEAIEGLHYAQSQGDTIASINVHHYVNIGNGRYLCDVTYLVDTKGWEGVVQTTNNAKIIVVVTDSGLKAETMTSY